MRTPTIDCADAEQRSPLRRRTASELVRASVDLHRMVVNVMSDDASTDTNVRMAEASCRALVTPPSTRHQSSAPLTMPIGSATTRASGGGAESVANAGARCVISKRAARLDLLPRAPRRAQSTTGCACRATRGCDRAWSRWNARAPGSVRRAPPRSPRAMRRCGRSSARLWPPTSTSRSMSGPAFASRLARA